MDPFKSSLEEGKHTSMLAGGRSNCYAKRERCKRDYTVQNNISAECGRQDLLLCNCQETDKTTMSTHLYRREEFQAFLAVLSIQVHFLNLSGRRGFAMATWLGLVGFSQCIRLYPLPVVALEHYNVSDQAQKLVKSNIELWFTVKSKTTKLQNVQKAIVTGCTISPILFVKAHQSCWKGNTKTKNSQLDTSSRKQGLHGWPNHLYWESHPSALGTTGTRRYCLLGTYEIQA